MKLFLMVLATVLALPSLAGSQKDLTNNIVEAFEILEEAASGGPSLAHFSYQTDFWVPSLEDCREISGKEAYRAVKAEVIENVLSGGGIERLSRKEERILKNAKRDLRSLLHGSEYFLCQKREFSYMAYEQRLSLISKKSDFRIQFVLGYED